MSKGRQRRARVAAQGGPRASQAPLRSQRSPWPEWLSIPVLASFGAGVVIGGNTIPEVGLVLIPVAFVLALVPQVRWITVAMATGFAAGFLLVSLLAPTELKAPLAIVALIALGIATGHYFARHVLGPMMARRQH